MQLTAVTLESHLIREGLAARTIQLHMQRFIYFNKVLPDYSTLSIDAWIVSMRAAGWKNNSINSYIKTLKKIGAIEGSKELSDTKYLPANETFKSTLSDSEIEALLAVKPPYTRKSQSKHVARWKMFDMLFLILAYTGARPHEIAALTIDNVDFGNNRFVIHATKVRRYRYIPIAPDIRERLKQYITSLDQDHLFTDCRVHNWSKQFNLRTSAIGIKRKGLTVYSLRHSFATRLVEAEGVNLFDVKSLMGHSKLATTEVYYHMSSKRLERTIKRDPLCNQNANDIIKDLKELLEKQLACHGEKLKYSIKYRSGSLKISVSSCAHETSSRRR